MLEALPWKKLMIATDILSPTPVPQREEKRAVGASTPQDQKPSTASASSIQPRYAAQLAYRLAAAYLKGSKN